MSWDDFWRDFELQKKEWRHRNECQRQTAKVNHWMKIEEEIKETAMEMEIPRTIEDAVEAIKSVVVDEDDREFLKENGVLSVHHSLGRWIRNNWGLWNGKSPLRKDFETAGITHPDDMSNYIIEKFVDSIKEDKGE